MSHINHKGPNKPHLPASFEPLNNRKNARPKSETIGQTYGERRQKASLHEEGWLKTGFNRAKDFFLGNGKKINNVSEFANKEDRYEESGSRYSANAVARKTRLEKGVRMESASKPPAEKYVHFLDSVITYLAPQKVKNI